MVARTMGSYGAPQVVKQSYASVVRTALNTAADATDETVATIVVPGGLMGPNSRLVLTQDYDLVNSALTKTMMVYFGGTLISSIGLGSSYEALFPMIEIKNANSLSTQTIFNGSSYAASTNAVNAYMAAAIDTASDVTILLRCKWSGVAGTETITFKGYSLVHYPGL